MTDFSPLRPVVKVCCIASVDEARLAIAAGAHALGLVSAMPSGPGVMADALAGVRLVQAIRVTGEASLDDAVAAAGSPRVDAILLDSGNPAAAVR